MPKTNAWRDLFIEIINEGPTPPGALGPEDLDTQRRFLAELIDSKHGNGLVVHDQMGNVHSVVWSGPTTEGRLLANQLADERERETLRYRLTQFGIGMIGWLGGLLSAWIIWWLTK